jgi:hypothetical protein
VVALLGQRENEIRDLGAVLAVDHAAAARHHVALEFFQVVVQVLDSVLLEGVSLRAQFLVVRKRVLAYGLDALFLEPSGGRIDG